VQIQLNKFFQKFDIQQRKIYLSGKNLKLFFNKTLGIPEGVRPLPLDYYSINPFEFDCTTKPYTSRI